jgi:transposase InsO family protein
MSNLVVLFVLATVAPMANSVCERFGGTLRRECLEYLIPINERHLKMTIQEWRLHYNRGRPHSSLGPGIPEPNQDRVLRAAGEGAIFAGPVWATARMFNGGEGSGQS